MLNMLIQVGQIYSLDVSKLKHLYKHGGTITCTEHTLSGILSFYHPNFLAKPPKDAAS